jgi:anti-sigma regulatory factor (Ser/Thr protein kinase)
VIPDRDLEDILLAVNEAATNAMLYGSDADHPVEVMIRVRGDWAEVTVLDRGTAGRGRRDNGEDPDVARQGGRGLWLMGRLVDEMRLERVEHGTRITLRRRITARGER